MTLLVPTECYGIFGHNIIYETTGTIEFTIL